MEDEELKEGLSEEELTDYWRGYARLANRRAELIQAQRDQAQADAAALREALHDYIHGPQPFDKVRQVFIAEHPGAALLAELEAARALRPEVRAFAGLMEAKLRENDHKPGWKQDDPYALYRRLCEEVGELRAALKKPFAVAGETADVANFAMMIADVCGWLVVDTDVRPE